MLFLGLSNKAGQKLSADGAVGAVLLHALEELLASLKSALDDGVALEDVGVSLAHGVD